MRVRVRARARVRVRVRVRARVRVRVRAKVRVRVRVEQEGEVLGADVQPAAADDARVHAHAQQLDLMLEVALRTRRSAGVRPSAGGLG